jgi:hypothetical protein
MSFLIWVAVAAVNPRQKNDSEEEEARKKGKKGKIGSICCMKGVL